MSYLNWATHAVLSMIAFSVPCLSVDAQELGGALQKVKGSASITIGHRELSPPFSYLDENKKPVGYSIDLCLRIVDEIRNILKMREVNVRYVAVNPQNRISMVVDGSIDLECGSTTNTLGRQQLVDFSPIFFTTGTRLLTWKKDAIKEIEDLSGKSIAVVGGSTNEKAVRGLVENGKIKDVSIAVVNDYGEGFASVEAKKSTAFATDDIVLFNLLSKSSKKDELSVTGRLLTYDPYGIMFRRDDPELRLAVTRALSRVFRSGEIASIYAKWFDSLGLPMSALLKSGFQLQAIPE